MKDNPLYQHPGVLILKRALKKEIRLQFLASMALAMLGFTLLYFLYQKNAILAIIGLIITVFGFRFALKITKNWEVEDHPLIRTLMDQPRQIVWVYSLLTERMPFGFQFSKSGTLYFKLVDGNEFSVGLSAKKLKLVTKTLNRLLPHASFGYSVQREQWFLQSPEKLRKDRDK